MLTICIVHTLRDTHHTLTVRQTFGETIKKHLPLTLVT